MISKGTTLSFGYCIEVYRGVDGLMVLYCRDSFGPEWPSMSYRMF